MSLPPAVPLTAPPVGLGGFLHAYLSMVVFQSRVIDQNDWMSWKDRPQPLSPVHQLTGSSPCQRSSLTDLAAQTHHVYPSSLATVVS